MYAAPWSASFDSCDTKFVEGNLKYLTQVNQFKGNATKYYLSVCKLLTLWECDEINQS
jgi:hypothetical protein